ncbi:cytochrome P450 6a2 [Leptinotarsa decemlineata]|uniref:cytochrome P450 6a2 n=1 Tax=Leptinotarsa decemlineata TaxID=7539 RepID=UPI003D30B60F
MEIYFLNLLLDLIIYASILLLVVYTYFSICFNYWRDRKFPYLIPKFPLGNYQNLLCKYPGATFENCNIYEEIRRKKHKFAGIFSITRPILVIADPEIAKDILVKDFDHFVDRGFYKTTHDPLSYTMFTMDGADWKKSRMAFSPSFTSGRVKAMIPLISSVSELMIKEIGDLATENADLDIKKLTTKFTINSLASCALGIEPGNSSNTDIFAKMARKQFHCENFTNSFRFTVLNKFPDFCSKLGLHLMDREVGMFFETILQDSIKYRKENNCTRSDMLELMVNLKKDTKLSSRPVTDNQLTAELLNFFIAALDTSPNTISFTLFELARNPDIQERVREEIEEVLIGNDGVLNTDCLKQMKYLLQVINETLRIYPPLPNVERKCSKDYKISGTDLTIERGTSIIIPIYGIQRDPENFSIPEKFDPERFSDQNKVNMKSYTFLPFGIGPRSCVGLRFGLTMVQIAVIDIIRRFKLSVSPTTKLPFEMDNRAFMLTVKCPILLKAEIIQNSAMQ